MFYLPYYFCLFMSISFNHIFYNLAAISYNVPAVTDGFWFAIKKMRSIFRKPKTVAETKRTKGKARLRFAQPSRFKRRTVTVLLCDAVAFGLHYFIQFFPFIS